MNSSKEANPYKYHITHEIVRAIQYDCEYQYNT